MAVFEQKENKSSSKLKIRKTERVHSVDTNGILYVSTDVWLP